METPGFAVRKRGYCFVQFGRKVTVCAPFRLPVHRLSREGWTVKYYFITFRSVTFAQRGERLLRKEGIRCSLQRTPKWMEAQGCGYSLRVWTREISTAAGLLLQAGLPLRKIYIRREDGTLEEMAP